MKGGNILQNISTKMKIVIAVVVVIIATTVGIYMYKQTQENTVSYYDNEEQSGETHISQITVHITGAINNPGVVVLEEGSRIVDALEAAGGETDEADVNRLNLAYVLEDGEKLYIQVALKIDSDKTAEREFGNLLKIQDNYPKIVVTEDTFSGNSYEGIRHCSIRQFLME